MKSTKRFAAFMLAAAVSLSGIWSGYGNMDAVQADTCGGLLEEDVYTPESYEVIQDPILHWAVRSAMNAIKSGVKLTEDMVGSSSVQNISYELCNHPEDFETWKKPYYVESLEGLQYAKSAVMIDICYTANIEGKRIDSVEPLAPLTQLEILYLKQDGIEDISPLSGLVNLEQLDVSGNYKIADIAAVRDMNKLKSLNVSINAVSDLSPVSGLSNLERLNAAKNQIEKLPDMSAMTSLKALDLSDNQLNDISQISKLENLEELNLSGNSALTDISPLVNLKNLKEDATYLPTEKMKTDLFAVIDVNKQFLTFNISKMTKDDIENVEKALKAYETLTQDQKAYFDTDRVKAAESNLELVKKDEEPHYYPEYDEGGEEVPVFDSITIQAVDKNGNPLKGVEFIREDEYGVLSPNSVTDENGKITYKHSFFDHYGSFKIYPAGETYVAQPEMMTYSVDGDGNTEKVNGKTATGLEKLVFTLISSDEYVDKGELQAAIKQAESINEEESYKYTEDSWNAFKNAWNNANTVNEQEDASQETVTAAAETLNTAYKGLTKTKILTNIKIIVKDKNGNLFTRPFKIQVRDAQTKADAWNGFSNAETGIAYMNCPAGWKDGKNWEFRACYEEPYEFDPFVAVVGVKDGKTYYKTVNGQTVGPDFEITVTVRPANKQSAKRNPDNTVLKSYIENAIIYEETVYTPGTWSKFQSALSDAEATVKKSSATQEDYNKAASDLLAAEKGLQKKADKTELWYTIDEYYSENVFTPSSWKNYVEAKQAASDVYDDPEATQEEVDQAEETLRNAIMALQPVATNKQDLDKLIQEAKELKAEDYVSGYEELQEVLTEAQKVSDNPEATYSQVAEWIEKIKEAMNALEEKPAEIPETCTENTFRAVVQNEKGEKLSGISFDFLADGEKFYSDESRDGIISYMPWSGDEDKTITVALSKDQGYTTDDQHSFKVYQESMWTFKISEINGQPYEDGVRLVYTLKEEGQSGGEDEVLSDSTTFRAKVVDENGNPLEGIQFISEPDDSFADTYTLTSNSAGIIEQVLTGADFQLEFEVYLKEGQNSGNGSVWSCEEKNIFTTDGDIVNQPTIVSINGKSLAEAGEIVYHLTKDGSGTSSVDKSKLNEKLSEAKAISNTDNQYTEDSFQNLQDAIKEAQTVYDKEDAEQKEIDQQVNNLQTAIDSLEKSGTSEPDEDKDDLAAWIGSAETYSEAEYTPESYAPLREAMNLAKSVMDNPEATAQEIQDAIAAIEKAIDGLEKADVPVYCEKNNIRIKVVDENGNRIKERVAFTFDRGAYGVYNSETYDGVVGYQLSTADTGITSINVYLKGGSVELNGKEYVADPESYLFGIKPVSNEVFIDTIDGEPFDASRQLTFTLKEKTAGSTVNKDALKEKVSNAEGLLAQKDSYTVNSFAAFESAYKDAKAALEADDIQQGQVDAVTAALESAMNNLKKVTGMRTLTIPVKLADGSPAPVNVEFVRRDIYYQVNHKIYVDGNGNLTWTPGAYDSGDYVFYLPEGSAYIATPGEITVHVGSEDGTPVIETIDQTPAADASVQFTLTDQGTDTCDLTHFRAVVQDSHGNLLSGIKFLVENGDPAELVSDENGVIEYEVTSWDTDMTMTVKLQEGQEWTTDQSIEFSVIEDPDDPSRGIIATINGQPFQDGEKLVFQLQKEGEVVLDWSSLESAMDKAEKLNPEKYTEESYAKVTEALEAARSIYGNEAVSQEQINQAAASLEEAMQLLQDKPGEPEKPQYSIIKGAGQQVNVDQDAVFTSDAEYSKFVKVLIDGAELSKNYYTVAEGSTVVTLKKEYLATLKEGKHTISIVSTDGTASTEFTIKKEQIVKPEDSDGNGNTDNKNPNTNKGNTQMNQKGNTAVKTGDNSNIMVWMITAAAAICLVMSIMIIRRRRK